MVCIECLEDFHVLSDFNMSLQIGITQSCRSGQEFVKALEILKEKAHLPPGTMSIAYIQCLVDTWMAVLCGLLVFWKFCDTFLSECWSRIQQSFGVIKRPQNILKSCKTNVQWNWIWCFMHWMIPHPAGWNLEDLLGTEKMFRRWWILNKSVRKSEKLDCTWGKALNRSGFILFHPTFILLVHISSSLLKIDLLARGGKRQSAATECNSSKLWWHKLISHLTRHRWPQTGR